LGWRESLPDRVVGGGLDSDKDLQIDVENGCGTSLYNHPARWDPHPYPLLFNREFLKKPTYRELLKLATNPSAKDNR
jgi:hypothetical protein